MTLCVYQNAEFLLIKTLIHTDTLFGLCLVGQHSPYPLSFKHTPLKTACPRLIKKAFIAKGCTLGGSIYQTTKSEVISVCFSTHLHYMCLCWIDVWCCMLGFPLNLGRAINSPLDSIITIQRIFFYVIYALWVFYIFCCILLFSPCEWQRSVEDLSERMSSRLILVQRNIAWETKGVK